MRGHDNNRNVEEKEKKRMAAAPPMLASSGARPNHFLCGSETNERFGRPRRRTGPLHSADSWEGHEPTEPIARAHTCSARARDARPRHLKRDGERREMKGLNRHCHYSSTVLAVPVRQLTWHGFLERGAAEPPELRRVIFDDGARPARRRSPLSFPSFDSPSSSSALTAWRSGRCSRAYSAVHHLHWSLRVARCVSRRRVFRYALRRDHFFCRSVLNVLSAVLIIEPAFFFALPLLSHFQSRVVWLSPACRSTFSTHVAPLLFSSALLRRIDRDIVAVWIHDSWFSFCCMHSSTPGTD